jgi:ADP-ribose pyrophosphatase YjhB (NUDIX family)
MKEKLKGLFAGVIFRLIALLTLKKISPILSACAIIEQDGKILLIERTDGLGFTIPGGITRYDETIEQCVVREVEEETGYHVALTGLSGVYSDLKRDPRFRAVSIAYKARICGGSEHRSSEGSVCWHTPEEVFGHMAFDCEWMLKDYLNSVQRLS